MNRSNITSFSFTVEDDLISQTSLNTTFVKPNHFQNKPFSFDYGPKGVDGLNHYQEQPVPTVQRKIMEQAQNDAYRDLNNDLFNPFEHRLQSGFIKKEADLYQREKQKQIEMIKQKELQQLNSAKNYTIVFNQNAPQSRSLKVAANNVINEDSTPSISDYYQQKFKKKTDTLEQITQEDQKEIKKNNFVADRDRFVKRIEKNTKQQRMKSEERPKLVKHADGWRREPQSQKQIENHPSNTIQNKVAQENKYKPPNIPKPMPKKENFKPKQIPKPASKPDLKPNSKGGPSKNMSKNQDKNKNQKSSGQKKLFSQIYEGPDRNLVEQLQKQICQSPNITFDDIAELETAKGLLQQAVLLPRMMPEFFKGIRKAMKGILLFGPPGTGKTLLAKAIATNNMFFNVSASSLASKWKGQSQKMVRILFQMARYHAPSIIFFDEIDALASKRSENENQSTRKVKTELLVQMDGVGNSEQSVFVLAATNRPWDLDEALRRRLEKRIYIPLPGKQGRKKMFEINLKELKVQSKINWEKLIQLTKGSSGADICNICRDAAYMPMRRKLMQVGGISKISQLSQSELLGEEISDSDLLEAAKKIKPSVGGEDLKRYIEWMKEFGSI